MAAPLRYCFDGSVGCVVWPDWSLGVVLVVGGLVGGGRVDVPLAGGGVVTGGGAVVVAGGGVDDWAGGGVSSFLPQAATPAARLSAARTAKSILFTMELRKSWGSARRNAGISRARRNY
jgi:hypothetical protein